MNDDLVKRLRESAEEWDDCKEAHNAFQDREAADRIEELERALRVAAGYISTKEGHADQHAQDVYDWIVRAALEKKK